jgi:hypothetical protein
MQIEIATLSKSKKKTVELVNSLRCKTFSFFPKQGGALRVQVWVNIERIGRRERWVFLRCLLTYRHVAYNVSIDIFPKDFLCLG